MTTAQEDTQIIFDGEEEVKEPSEETKKEPTAAPKQQEEETGSSHREYVILKKIAPTVIASASRVGDPEITWGEIKRVQASGAETAIRSLGEDGLEDGATYVAVPSRSWNPIPVAVKKITTITVGQ